MTERVIPLNRTKIVLLVVGAIAFVAAGLWIWSIADTRPEDAVRMKATAVAAIGFFGLCAVYGSVKLFDRKPGLVIDAEGIIDNSSAVAVGRIAWSDVVAITVNAIERQRFLTVAVRDPQKYAARGGPLRRLLHAANLKRAGSPINISSTALRIGFDELECALSDALRASRDAAKRA